MALTYRSPVEEILGAYTTIEQSLISSTSLQSLRGLEQKNYKHFSYAISVKAKEKLVTSGLYLSPFSAIPHSHPVCKTLENHLLYNVLPSYIDSSFYLVGIKKSKVEFLRERKATLNVVEFLNRFVTSKDKMRYGSEFHVSSTATLPQVSCSRIIESSETLRNLLPAVIRNNSRKMFLHDELHYWKHTELISFLEAVKPEVLLATIVIPPELLAGSKMSLNTWAYEYEIKKGRLFFYPDGVREEGYDQPAGCTYLLKAKRIILPNGDVYCLDLLHSKFSHHLISITRGNAITDESRAFGNFEAISTEELRGVANDIRSCYPISHDVVTKIYMYLETLLKPDNQSAMAKLSQLVGKPTGFEIRFIQDFSRFVMKNRTISMDIMGSYGVKMVGFLAGMLPNFAARIFASYREITLQNFITTLCPYTFSVKLIDITLNHFEELVLLDHTADVDIDLNLEDFIDDMFINGGPCGIVQRLPNPVVASAQFDWVEFDLERVRSFFVGIICESCNGRGPKFVNLSYVESYIMKFKEVSVISNCMYNSMGKGDFEKILIRVRNRIRGSIMVRFWAFNLYSKNNFNWFTHGYNRLNVFAICNDYGLNFSAMKLYNKIVLEVAQGGISRASLAISNASRLDAQAELLESFHIQMGFETTGSDLNGHYYEESGNFLIRGGNSKIALDEEKEEIKKELAVEERIEEGSNESASERSEEVAFDRVIFEKACYCSMKFEVGNFQGSDFVRPLFIDVLKGRTAGWYSKDGSGYSYNGGCHKSLGWPQWADVILTANGWDVHNFDCFLAQKYNKNSKIGFHADDESNIKKNSAILTLNLNGRAIFNLRGNKRECAVKQMLEHGEYLLMPPGCQETHQHSVEVFDEGRISITFRSLDAPKEPVPVTPFTEEIDVEALKSGTTIRWKDVVIEIEPEKELPENVKIVQVPGDGDCYWHSLGFFMGLHGSELKNICKKKMPSDAEEALREQMQEKEWAQSEAIALSAHVFGKNIEVYDKERGVKWSFMAVNDSPFLEMQLVGSHFSPMISKNDCVVQCVSSALGRNYASVLEVLGRPSYAHLMKELKDGGGISIFLLEEIFVAFGIRAEVDLDGEVILMNPEGELKFFFKVEGDHIEHVKPAKWSKMPALRSNDVENFPPSALRVLETAGTKISYLRSRMRAEVLSESLHAGTTGAICSKVFSLCENLMKDNTREEILKDVIAVVGTFGAGKSYLFKEFIGKSPGKHVTFVSPRKNLAEAVKAEIFGLKQCKNLSGKLKRDSKSLNWNVFTFEVFIKICNSLKEGQVVIIDEIQLFPPGYLDLALFLMPESVKVYIVGDPCQSDYDSEQDRSLFTGVLSDVQKALHEQDYKYVSRSRRFINANFIKRLPCLIQEGSCALNEPYHLLENFEELDEIPSTFKNVFLVSSFDEKKIVRAHYPNKGIEVLTFGESTGLTFRKGTILVTPNAFMASEKRWVTAMSRFAENLAFLNLSGNSFKELVDMYANRCFSKFLTGKACEEDLIDLLPGRPKFVENFSTKIGKERGLKEEKLAGDPYLKCMVDLAQAEDAEEIEYREILMQEPDFKTHLPRCELESVRASWVHKILAKEDREVRLKNCVTNQFSDQHSKNHGKVLSNAAERFEAIYPRHKGTDTATFLMAVKKRLRFSRPAVEQAKLKNASIFGEAMLKLFLSKVPLKSAHNHKFMSKAKEEFERKKTSKSAATLANHSNRSCRDWLADVGMVFMKSQICTKFDNRFIKAKAAQSIVCFQHSVLCRFAPYMRYIEMKLNEVLPKNFYIHSGKSLDELNDWVKRGKFDGVCTESDYEAFDASQDQFIMAFEIEVMKYLGIPKDLIADYIYIKTHLGSKLGNFAIMRFSGEASTFLFNTMANMLFTFMRYDLNGKEFICFAGDDMCASKHLRIFGDHEVYLNKIKLKAKVAFTKNPTFCGWNLTPLGIYKKPQLILERMCIAKETNNLINCIDNYALEVAYAYKMGEYATTRMSREEVESHYNCVRIIIMNMHMIKSDAWQIFKGAKL